MAGFKSNKLKEQAVENIEDFFKVGTSLGRISSIRLGLYADTKVGKTHFAMSLPGEKYIIDLEGNVSEMVTKFPKEIREKMYVFECSPMNPATNKIDYDYAVERIEKAVAAMHARIKSMPEGTPKGFCIIDSSSDLWEYLGFWLTNQTDLARSQASGKMIQTEWGRANQKHKKILDLLQDTGWHIVIIAKANPVYGEGGKKLDITEPKWQKNTPFWCNVVAELKFNGLDRTFVFNDTRFSSAEFPSLSGIEIKSPTWQKVIDTIATKTGIEIE